MSICLTLAPFTLVVRQPTGRGGDMRAFQVACVVVVLGITGIAIGHELVRIMWMVLE